MSILNRFWAGKPLFDESTAEGALLAAFLQTVGSVDWPAPKLESLPGGQTILDQDPEAKARIAVVSFRVLAHGPEISFSRSMGLKAVVNRLLRSRLPFDEEQLIDLARGLPTRGAWNWELSATSVVSALERHVEAHGLSARLRLEIRRLNKGGGSVSHASSATRRRLAGLLQGGDDVLAKDPWGLRVAADLSRLPEDDRRHWQALLAHAATAAGKTRPSKTWARQAIAVVDAIGPSEVCAAVGDWLEGWTPGPAEQGKPYLDEANSEVLRGLVWAAAPGGDASFGARVGRLAEVCFRKIRWHGPRSPRLGNACLVALGRIGDHQGISELTRLEGKVRYDTARRMISSTLEAAAKAAGLTRTDLEELRVPDYGLDADGRCRRSVADGEAELSIEGGKVNLRWHRGGRTTKGAPKALREADPGRVKEMRQTAKELAATLSGQAGRIERFYLAERSLAAADWRQRYLDHPLVATVARRLAWTLHQGGESRAVLWRDGALRGLEGEVVDQDLDTESRISLWHPARSSVDEVRAIRRRLEADEVTQPFKQAHREIYLLTDAERSTATYSNRFAAHIVRQHQFQTLCQQRGWKYQLQGAFDSFDVPSRLLTAWDLVVELWVEPVVEHTTEAGIFQYLTTDQLCFQRHGHRLDLSEVPDLALSEAMRDVDLFTSVSSIGNDPQWRDRGENPEGGDDYWTSFAFGDLNATAETRREVLAGLVPRLKIAKRCRLEDRWLVVRGDLRTYRIHLRSGHVMMEPNQQYLCIVSDRSSKGRQPRVYLPFEGDAVLSLILSKAFLLAADCKIKDPTILSQIGASASPNG